MTKKSKIFAWVLIILSYVATFGIPLTAAYHYLAKETIAKEAGVGGALFWIVTAIISLAAVISINKLINKMKANTFKSLFKGLTKIGFIYLLKMMLMFTTINVQNLDKVIDFSIMGLVIGTLIQVFAVTKYNEYIREVGIL